MTKQSLCMALLCLAVAPVQAHKVEGTTHVHHDVIQQQLVMSQTLDADAHGLAGTAQTLSVHQHSVLPKSVAPTEQQTLAKDCELPLATGKQHAAQQNVERMKAC